MTRVVVKTNCLSLILLYRKIPCSHFSFGIVSISIFLELTDNLFMIFRKISYWFIFTNSYHHYIKYRNLILFPGDKIFFKRSVVRDNSLHLVLRNICPEMFCKQGVPWNFANLQENTCVRVSFFIKLQLPACNFIKMKLWHRCVFLPVLLNF